MGVRVTLRHGQALSLATAKKVLDATIMSAKTVTGAEDVFGYAEAYEVAVQSIDAVEIFIEVNEVKSDNFPMLADTIAQELDNWKHVNSFQKRININVIPITWHFRSV